MDLRIGTSGYAYREWKGPFYPEKIRDADMLGHYGQRLSTVEMNNTFYRMPRTSALQSWAASVPEGFQFAIKAPQRITHRARLKNAGDSVEYLSDQLQELGDKLGPVLFQLPPYLRKDVPRLSEFLAILPRNLRAAFEFRHASWHDDEVYETLRGHDAALCLADREDPSQSTPVVATAGWGYVRLRGSTYHDEDLRAWAHRLHEQPWTHAYVFFKHEDEGVAPELALRFGTMTG